MENFISANDESRQRLETLISRLSDTDLLQVNVDGWTVAALLGHLAFWDQRALLLIRYWKEHGVQLSPVDVDIINDATRPFLVAIPPRFVSQLVIETATLLDTEIAALPPSLLNDILLNAKQFYLSRANHRHLHITEIEQLLAG